MQLDAAAKRRIKNRKLLAKSNNLEPDCNWETKEQMQKGLGYALTWYSQNTNKKDQKKYVLDHYKVKNKEIHDKFKELEEWRFITLGSICRMKDKGGYREEWSDSPFFDRKVTELLAVYEKQKVEIAARKQREALEQKNLPKPKTIQERIWDAASDIGAEYDYQIDEFTTTKNFVSDFSATQYLAKQGVSSAVASKVLEWFLPIQQELKDAYAGKDEQLVEGYSHITRQQLKKFRDFVNMLVEDTKQYAQSSKKKIVRKTRVVPPQRRVARLKYQTEDKDLNLKSITPTKILDTAEIWIYNTKYKRLQCYVSDGTPLGIKGTTIVGFDVKKSFQQTLRKPDQFFKGLTIGKRALANAVKQLKTKPAEVNGRVNENCILLGAFI